MKVFEVVEAGEELVGTGILGPDGKEIMRPSDSPKITGDIDSPDKPKSGKFSGLDNIELDGKKGLKATTVDGKVIKGKDPKEFLQNLTKELDPKDATKVNSKLASRVSKLDKWFTKTKLGKFVDTLKDWVGKGGGALAGGAVASGLSIYEFFDTIHPQFLENMAALDILMRNEALKSASSDMVYAKAKSNIESAYNAAIATQIVGVLVAIVAGGKTASRIVSAIRAPLLLTGPMGWIGAALITVLTEGLFWGGSWLLQKYGPKYFAYWFEEEWSSAPVAAGDVKIGGVELDMDDPDLNSALQKDAEQGNNAGVQQFKQDLLKGIDLDKMRKQMGYD